MKISKLALLTLMVVAQPGHAVVTLVGNGSGPAAQDWTTTQTSGNGSQNGFFGGADPNGNGGSASVVSGNGWGMYANSGQTVTASFSTGNLNPQGGFPAFIQLGLDNGSTIQGGGGFGSGVVGIQYFDGATLAFEFRYVGGNSLARWEFGDSSGFNQTSTVGYSTNGFNFRFAQTGTNSYTFSVNGSAIRSGTLAGGAGLVDSLRVFNNNAGSGGASNVVFNNLVYQVPEPTSALLCGLGIVGLMRRRR